MSYIKVVFGPRKTETEGREAGFIGSWVAPVFFGRQGRFPFVLEKERFNVGLVVWF